MRRQTAFTLIELLIVVAIIGILAAIAVPNFLNAQIKAKIARAESEMKSIGQAYMMYFMDRNGWPPHLDGHPAQHRYVTTPIAYLSTSIVDVFAFQDKKHPKFHSTFQGQYHSEPNATHHGRFQFYPGMYEQTWNVAYVMISHGPDAQHDHEWRYDTSNGLTSIGDIWSLFRGEYQPKFPFDRRR